MGEPERVWLALADSLGVRVALPDRDWVTVCVPLADADCDGVRVGDWLGD